MKKFVIGCGYLGFRVAERWQADGHEVHVATRSAERASQLAGLGYLPHILDVTQPDSLTDLPSADTVLYAVGFDRTAGFSREAIYQHGLKSLLAVLPAVTDRFIYISSTGVYGQGDGQWVDEESMCQPNSEGGRNCLGAESILQASQFAAQSVILRLAGIYGPDRVPMIKKIRQQEPLPVAADGHLNLIHVDDAASAVLAAEQAKLPSLYVVSDGQPVVRREYYAKIGEYLGVTPAFVAPEAGSGRADRAGSSKRVRSQKIVNDLALRWAYPDYRAGLAAIMPDIDEDHSAVAGSSSGS